MRLERLDLLCYGHFRDKTIDFAASEVDFHIIYGPNEAGKSTALSAIEDLLFGFPTKTSYSFLFGNKDLRVGAVAQNGMNGKGLSFRRRKGKKDTLFDENDVLLADTALAEFLRGVERPFFDRMFCLDHERLRRGGQDILNEKDDVGGMLFSASAGLQGVTEVLGKLEKNASEHWSPRRAPKYLYYKAEGSFEDAKKRKKDATLLSRNWREVQEIFAKVSDEHEKQKRLHVARTADQEKIQRIRRTLPYLVQIKNVEEEISKFGSVPAYPKNASKIMEDADRELNKANAALKILAEQIGEAKKELDCITIDEIFLCLEEKIKKIQDNLAVVENYEADIPHLQTEIETLNKKRQGIAIELSWSPEKIEKENFFPKTLYLRIESLIVEKGSLDPRLESIKDSLQDAVNRCNNLHKEITEFGEVSNITLLETAIRHAKGKGGFEAEIKQDQDEVSNLNRKTENSLKSLQPWKGTTEDLEKLIIPQGLIVEQFIQETKDASDSRKNMAVERQSLKRQLSEHLLEKEQILRDKQAVSSDQLEEARQRRDNGWYIIRRKYFDNEDVSEDEANRVFGELTIPKAYEESVVTADSLADKRFDHAEEAARLTDLSRTIEKWEHKLEELVKDEEDLWAREKELNERWNSVWKDCGILPLSPQEMSGWMDRRNEILEDYEQKLARLRRINNLKEESQEARTLLVKGINQAVAEAGELKDQSLHMLLENAETIKSDLDKKAARMEELRKQALVAENQRDKAKEKYDKTFAEKKEWDKQWREALKEAEFAQKLSLEDIRLSLSNIKKIEDYGQEISKIRIERIEAMGKEIDRFDSEVDVLIDKLKINKDNTNNKQIVYTLVYRLEEERSKKSKKETQTANLKALENKMSQQKESRETALAKLQPLFKTAETEDLFELRKQVEVFAQLRDSESKMEGILTALLKQGEGKDRKELEDECQGMDTDYGDQQTALLANELNEINLKLQNLSVQKSEAKAEVDKISGQADAAVAEADRQLALTDMGMSAEQYVKAQTATILLRWGMEKFRKEKQGPLLGRASEIFKILTALNYSKLTVELDDNDNPILVGVRGEKSVEVEGMSDGTVDQLYLAIRLAAIEEYIQSSQPLPLIVDDLFINFDDERAVAGFNSLKVLAKKTQVLFFTHHRHLVELAKSAFGKENLFVHNL
jgi:uncharacterized protein YhaN